MQSILFVGLGGFLGAVSRYLVAGWVQTLGVQLGFPLGTLAVNLLGCFVIGFLSQLGMNYNLFNEQTRLTIFVGFLGSFTTYSTFSNDALALFQFDKQGMALAYVGLHLFVGLSAVWLGQWMAKGL